MIFRNRNLWAAREEVGASGHPSPFSHTDTVLRMYKFKLRAAQGRPFGIPSACTEKAGQPKLLFASHPHPATGVPGHRDPWRKFRPCRLT